MGTMNVLRQAFLKGYATSDIKVNTIVICVVVTLAIASYVYCVYRTINKNSFYNRNFNMSLVAIAVITAAIILTVQSNIVVSLGMVGALSIVRFRTAIKDPMDLVFLFWSISVGIICGAGFALIAVIASLAMTVVIAIFHYLPAIGDSQVLVVNFDSYEKEKEIIETIKKHCKYMKVRARNISKTRTNIAVEVRVKDDSELIRELMGYECVTNASLVASDGDVTV